MNAAALEPVRWSRRRWIYTVAALFLAQAALVFYLGRRESIPPQRRPFSTVVYLVADAWSSNQLAQLPDLNDPLLLALPNLNGFSGPAWLKFAPLDYRTDGWTEPPRWLPLEEHALGQTFSQFVSTNRVPPPLIADKPLPPLLRYEPNFPSDPLPQKSRLRLEGDLANRPLLAPLEIKSWPYSDILSNTTVEAVVDADGFTVSTRPLTGSGLPEVDLYALQVAAGARFQPLPRSGVSGGRANQLTWGRMVFLWHTLPLPATNLQSGPP
jgi:hypothetical protein